MTLRTCGVELLILVFIFFFFNDTATTEIYTLSLHDALPIWRRPSGGGQLVRDRRNQRSCDCGRSADRKSTRLNSSHSQISYAVFCLKKKRTNTIDAYHTHDRNPVAGDRVEFQTRSPERAIAQ